MTESPVNDDKGHSLWTRAVTPPGRDWTAFALAIALGTSVNLVTIGVLVQAINSDTPGLGISENATQLLTNAFSGIVGLLGSYIGFRAGAAAKTHGGMEAAAQYEENAASNGSNGNGDCGDEDVLQVPVKVRINPVEGEPRPPA